MPKPTIKPVGYERVTSDRFPRGILDLEQRCGSIEYATLSRKSFTLVLLLVDTNNMCEVVRFLL